MDDATQVSQAGDRQVRSGLFSRFTGLLRDLKSDGSAPTPAYTPPAPAPAAPPSSPASRVAGDIEVLKVIEGGKNLIIEAKRPAWPASERIAVLLPPNLSEADIAIRLARELDLRDLRRREGDKVRDL